MCESVCVGRQTQVMKRNIPRDNKCFHSLVVTFGFSLTRLVGVRGDGGPGYEGMRVRGTIVRLYSQIVQLDCIVRLYSQIVQLDCTVRLYSQIVQLDCIVRLYSQIVQLDCIIRIQDGDGSLTTEMAPQQQRWLFSRGISDVIVEGLVTSQQKGQ